MKKLISTVKRGPGKPRYEPTESDRNTVKAMAINGVPHETICTCLGVKGIDKKTMYRYFREELDTALAKANGAVGARLYEMAIAGDPPAATFFWLKCKAGWKEKHEFEVTGVGGGPVEISVTAKESLTRRIAGIAGRASLEGSISAAE